MQSPEGAKKCAGKEHAAGAGQAVGETTQHASGKGSRGGFQRRRKRRSGRGSAAGLFPDGTSLSPSHDQLPGAEAVGKSTTLSSLRIFFFPFLGIFDTEESKSEYKLNLEVYANKF